MLTVSSAHVTKRDGEKMSQWEWPVIMKGEFGSIFLTMKVAKRISGKYSKHLHSLLRLARDNDCEYLRVDADGPVLEGFPVFDW